MIIKLLSRGQIFTKVLSKYHNTEFCITIAGQKTMSTKPEDLTIGFVGAGRMATALCRGFIKAGHVTPKHITASDRSSECFKPLLSHPEARGVTCTMNNKDVINKSQVIFFAVKPHTMYPVLNEIKSSVPQDKLIVSVAAGVQLDFIEDMLGPNVRVIRVMPNTPCLVLTGASVFARGRKATDADADLIRTLMNSTGVCDEVPEKMMDAVTGLSGSGPAFMYMALEAMADGGVKMGLPRELAVKLAAQTMLGSAKMVLETNCHSASLKDDVCSPGGTTITGVHVLEERGFRGTIIAAVEAATKKSKEMSDKNKANTSPL